MVLTHIAWAAIVTSVLKGFLRAYTQRRALQFHASILKGLKEFHGTAELNKRYMKTKILSLLVALLSAWSGNVALAQFTSDKVLIYVKAGQEPSKASNICVIGYFVDDDEIINRLTDADRIRKIISSHSRYLSSPYNLVDVDATLFPSYRSPKICKYNSTASTSKYRVYSGHQPAGSNVWGSWEASTKNWAFSKDGKRLIFWESGNENNRITYLLTAPAEFDPSTSTSSNYDFLE